MTRTSPYLQYLNRLNLCPEPVTSIETLSDGIHLYHIIAALKQFQNCFPYEIVLEPLTFIHRIKNIKSLIKAIHQFWSVHIRQQLCYEIDAIKIAKDKSVKEIQKLIRLLVKTLFQTKDKLYFIQKVLETSQQTQQFFMDLVKEQTSIQFTSPKSSKHTKNHHQSLYDKLLELQHQNEHFIRLMEELASENHEYAVKQKEFQEKINEKEAQIRRLNWALNQASQKKHKPQENDLSFSRQRFSDEMTSERIKQIQEREKAGLIELERCKHLIRFQQEELKRLRDLQANNNHQTEEIQLLRQYKNQLQASLTESRQSLKAFQCSIKSLNEQSSKKLIQLASYQARVAVFEQQASSKAQQIQQLENNIRYLTQQKEDPAFRQNGSSMKQDCRQAPVIVRKKRQTDKVNRDLRSALITVNKQQKQIERLRNYEQENKKLVQMISHMQKYRGEQNQVLVHCLYKMRTQILQKQLKHSQTIPRNPLGEISLNE